MKRYAILVAVVVSTLVAGNVGRSAAQGPCGPVAQALAGAYTARVLGPEAAVWEPAALRGPDAPRVQLLLGGVGATAATNGVSLDLYNRVSGAFLDGALKQEIMSALPADGLRVRAQGEATPVGLSVAGVGVAAHVRAQGSARLPRDLADLALYGNDVERSYSFAGIEGGGLATAGVVAGTALALRAPHGMTHLAVGASLEDIVTARGAEVMHADGAITTSAEALSGQGEIAYRVGETGHGFGATVGVEAASGDRWRAAFALRSIGSVHFTSGTLYHRSFNVDTLTIDEGDGADIVTTSSDSTTISGYNVALPTSAAAGCAYRLGPTLVSADVQVALRRSPGAQSGVGGSVGVELWPHGVVHLRTGVGAGTPLGFRVGAGAGLTAGPLLFDLAAMHYGAPSPSATRGIGVAGSLGLRFP
jgi:hypothetical protein